MDRNQKILIRADAGGGLGTGHVMRMIALAQAWQDRGGIVYFASCSCPEKLQMRLAQEEIHFNHWGELEGGSLGDSERAVEFGKKEGISWVVLDGYHFGEAYQAHLKESGFKVLAVDDYGHCDRWNADIVLNQNIRREQDALVGLHGDHIQWLEGPKYALLRREFDGQEHWQNRRDSSAPLKLLITFGGVDPTNATARILEGIRSIENLSLEIKVLAGPANPNLENLAQIIEIFPYDIDLIPSSDDMPNLYQWADRIISAGGSSCYEWLLFRKAGWITSVADNQSEIVREMLRRGYAAGLETLDGISGDEIAESIGAWLLEESRQTDEVVVDGYGSRRVTALMDELPFWIRETHLGDADFLIELANEPSVRNAGEHPQIIQRPEHIEWLTRHLESQQTELYIVEIDGVGPVGQIRFHSRELDAWEIGVSLTPSQRMNGLAKAALMMAMNLMTNQKRVQSWIAEIRNENIPSQKLFARLGFCLSEKGPEMQKWEKRRNRSKINVTKF
ncbi:UDP-2,4-diacetamido-2,4,6-trideoxy-beta-L-altropyranose hydrolase [Akkermansiaceae bacterium]|nr:UDP-2,4-diacetamido-2,4,6-trideoxy-beta-L-altropyranose hydrolase [Akkermansiaceae bacterium]MDA8980728.1 UDP-2,4-diacetamido-2,4,6-trideoxy-beta-L-altropyranose hydrolase [bacterium]MDB4508615.1 UDP-2,4-diacetamido-2,4,6-trideoxy-beta-L-altropyranose hydrolase [Akkermansiaceae bacterium]